jgi:hypothetical protein
MCFLMSDRSASFGLDVLNIGKPPQRLPLGKLQLNNHSSFSLNYSTNYSPVAAGDTSITSP